MPSRVLKHRNGKDTKNKVINKEVLERLPYWVHEMLRMLEEVNRAKARRVQAPSASSSEAP